MLRFKALRQKVLNTLVAALFVAASVGCGGGATGSGTSAPAESAQTESADSTAPAASDGTASENAPVAEGNGNFNPTGFPIVNEPVTKRFMINKPPHIVDPTDMVTLQEYEKMTNVTIEWDVVSSDGFIERLNLVLASNSMPDAILKSLHDQTVIKASTDGAIIDMNGLIDQYSEGIKALFEQYPDAKLASLSPDGGLYSLPTINTLAPNRTVHRNLWLNQKWMDNLGLTTPTTLDEFADVLRAFRDQDANGNGDATDEIPYVVELSGGNHVPRTDVFLGSWGIVPNFMVNPATGMGHSYLHINAQDAVEAFILTDAYKEVLQFMNMLWSEQLLDNAIYTQTSDVALSKFNSEISGAFGLSSDDLFSAYSTDYVGIAPPKNGDIQQTIALNPVASGKSMVITSADETPEVSMRWIDYFYTDEGSRFIGAMSESQVGVTAQKLPDGSIDYSEELLNSPKGIGMAVGDVCPLPGGGFPYWRNENNSNFIYSAKVRENVPVWEPFYQTVPSYAFPVFDAETNERVIDIRRDLDVYIVECEAKFISGEMSFDGWDQYVETLKQMNIEELVGYFQTAYDSMK